MVYPVTNVFCRSFLDVSSQLLFPVLVFKTFAEDEEDGARNSEDQHYPKKRISHEIAMTGMEVREDDETDKYQ